MKTQHLLPYFDKLSDSTSTLIKGYHGDSQVDISGKDFCSEARKVSELLRTAGVRSGDRIAIIAEKRPESIISFFGTWLSDAVAVPVCETLQDKETSFIIRDSGAKAVLCAESLKARLQQLVSGLNIPVYGFSSWKTCNPDKDATRYPYHPEDIAFIIYTSGSTGNPKGVILTHRNIYINASTSAEYIKMSSDDAIMSILPYWHSFALTGEIFTMFHVGGKIFIPKNKSTLLKDMNIFKPTIVLSIPRLAEMLKKGIEKNIGPGPYRNKEIITLKVRESFGGRIKYFVGGGAPLDESLQHFFSDIGIPMYQGYGLTESSPVISINAPGNHKTGTSGKVTTWLTPDFEGDYTFMDDSGRMRKDIKGELLVKGLCTMKGYWNLPDETTNTFMDDWLRTGDVGYIDEDGFLVLCGRKKSLLCLAGGEKFYPEVIEEKLKSSPYIMQAMVVGEGQKRASVVLNTNAEMTKSLSPEETRAVIAEEIRRLTNEFEPYQRPSSHLILPEFTYEEGLVTATQKIRRHKVMEKYQKEIDGLFA